eukprot:gene5779-biopygen9342
MRSTNRSRLQTRAKRGGADSALCAMTEPMHVAARGVGWLGCQARIGRGFRGLQRHHGGTDSSTVKHGESRWRSRWNHGGITVALPIPFRTVTL